MTAAPTLHSVLGTVRPLIEAGASLHWLMPFEKRPIAAERSKAPFQTEADLRAAYRDNANIGIRLGEPSKIDDGYLHLIDLDIREPGRACEAWSKLLELWPSARDFPCGISGSGGDSRHIYFISPVAFPKKKLAKSSGFTMVWDQQKQREVRKYDWEIDILGTGSQAVLPPSIHPDTRQPYRWELPLDLDFPFMMTLDPSLIETWGISAASAIEIDDDDDLFGIVRAAPMDLDADEVTRILADLPPDWVDDRDQWLTVGAALHHQFEGTNQGLERWNEWAKQSPKFDARDSARVWRSFKGSRNPIRMATLIQAAKANRLKSELGLDSDDFHPPATASSYDLSDLLGYSQPATGKADVIEPPDTDWLQKLHRNESGELKSTLPNVGLIVENDLRTRETSQFNEFKREKVLQQEPKRASKRRERSKPVVNLDGPHWKITDRVNGDTLTDTHYNDIRRMIEAPVSQGGYGIKVSDRDLYAAVDMAARKRSFHPVRERLLSETWDGRPRAATLFIDYLGCEDTSYHRETATLFLLGAVARVFQPGHKFDFVPILEGAQGQGKSTFIRILGLDWFRELAGDISKPQEAVSMLGGAWILEIGELSAMQRSEVNDLKAFISRQVDNARMPYERAARDFPRQCVFMGSTNDGEYLRDITGGRRFWPIKSRLDGQIDNQRLRREVMQIWAEVVHMYMRRTKGQTDCELPLYLSDEAAVREARALQESRRVETAEEMLAGMIQAWLDTPVGAQFDDLDRDAPKVLRSETCVAQIWEEMMGRDGAIPQNEAVRIGKAMLIVGWNRSAGVLWGTAVNKKYGKCRV